MVSRVRIPKGKRRPPGTKTPRRTDDPRKLGENTRKKLIEYYRGLRQKPGGTKPKPKAVPKGTKTGPAVKGEMSTRPKKPDYRPKGVKPKVTVKADPEGYLTDPIRVPRGTPVKPKDTPLQPGMKRPIRKAKPGSRPRPKITKPSSGPTPKTVPPGMRTPRGLSPKRPTRKPPTRRPSRRPRGMMDAIRRNMRGRRRGSQR